MWRVPSTRMPQRPAPRNIAIDAGSLGNRGGQIVQSGTDATRITIVGAIDNSAGTIASNGHLNVAAGSLANQGGAVRAAGHGRSDMAGPGAGQQQQAARSARAATPPSPLGSLNNDAGQRERGRRPRATVGGAATNVGGTLAANGNTTLVADTLDNSRAQRLRSRAT
jgi:filamentous hemagglutinin